MVHRLRKQKSYCHVIAIPQASIAAPTLTVMQGFEAKKRLLGACPSPLLHTASILHIIPFHAIATHVRIEPGCNGCSDGVEYSTSEYEYEYRKKLRLRVRVLILKNVLEYEYRKKVRVRVLLQV